jgi:rhodanese-related sulfurtransferase
MLARTLARGYGKPRMSTPKIVTPEGAAALLAQGYTYLDVRSEPEFEAGHPEGALNVPISHATPTGMQPNPEFLSVVEQAFSKDEKLVIGCKSGGRSKRAAALLANAGFTNIVDMGAGWDGSRDAFGRVTPGWSASSLPKEVGSTERQRYSGVKQRKA